MFLGIPIAKSNVFKQASNGALIQSAWRAALTFRIFEKERALAGIHGNTAAPKENLRLLDSGFPIPFLYEYIRLAATSMDQHDVDWYWFQSLFLLLPNSTILWPRLWEFFERTEMILLEGTDKTSNKKPSG